MISQPFTLSRTQYPVPIFQIIQANFPTSFAPKWTTSNISVTATARTRAIAATAHVAPSPPLLAPHRRRHFPHPRRTLATTANTLATTARTRAALSPRPVPPLPAPAPSPPLTAPANDELGCQKQDCTKHITNSSVINFCSL